MPVATEFFSIGSQLYVQTPHPAALMPVGADLLHRFGLQMPIAGAEDLIGVLVFLLFIVISIVSKMLEAAKKGQQKPIVRNRPLRPDATDPLAREIDDFLNGSQGRRDDEVTVAEVVEPQQDARGGSRLGSGVDDEASRFDSHMKDTFDHKVGTFNEQSEHLGTLSRQDDAGDVDEYSEALMPRLTESDLSNRSRSRRETDVVDAIVADAGTPAASSQTRDAYRIANLKSGNLAQDVADMLTNPREVSKAIILSEVLTRPEHRWD